MPKGKSGMGMSKHRKSGSTTYSPKLRHALSRRAANQITFRKTGGNCKFSTVAEIK